MPKGYWVASVEVTDPEAYQAYVAAGAVAYARYGAVPLARGGRSAVLEGSGRSRNVIWEFPTFDAAVECYNSAEYQEARALRESIAVGDFVVVEGVGDD